MSATVKSDDHLEFWGEGGGGQHDARLMFSIAVQTRKWICFFHRSPRRLKMTLNAGVKLKPGPSHYCQRGKKAANGHGVAGPRAHFSNNHRVEMKMVLE